MVGAELGVAATRGDFMFQHPANSRRVVRVHLYVVELSASLFGQLF